MASSIGWQEALEKLREYSKDQARCSEHVVDLWELVIANNVHKLGNDVWSIYEQVCIAACDCGRQDIAQDCITRLNTQFSNSNRVERLKGLYFESIESYEKAEAIYNQILEDNPNDSIARKRQVAVLKSQNKIPDAIKELNDYLRTFQSDAEGWSELCDLYLMEQDYTKACFCLEELIMSNPHNHLYFQKLAEVKYTQGNAENMEEARKYFAQAVKLNPSNIRALYGLFMAASSLAASVKSKDKKDNMKYAAWASDQINKRYKERSKPEVCDQLKAIEGMLDSLQLHTST